MGSDSLSLPFSTVVSTCEASNVGDGLIPESMDDKWVGFWDEKEVGFYRSWTGHQIYRLKKEETKEGFRLGPVDVLNDGSVYRRTTDEFDLKMVSSLLNKLLKKNEN